MRLNIENKARLAFVVLLLVAAAMGLAWFFLATRRYVTYEVRTRDAVAGLIADAPVEFHGVEVGRVEDIARAARADVAARGFGPFLLTPPHDAASRLCT
jgi:phospholipid/cholesterol/gamma-HCH transport system substrate-binding protein